MDEKLACKNIRQAIMPIKYSDLERVQEGFYKSKCPVCHEGVLPLSRDLSNKGKIIEHDTCLLCGQRFRYIDFETI